MLFHFSGKKFFI